MRPKWSRSGKDLVLHRQERTARVDQVNARQVVLLGDLLGAQMLLNGQREVRAALDRCVVGDHHAMPAFDGYDAGHDACRGRFVAVDAARRERRELQEGRERVGQPVDPLARGQLAAFSMPGQRLGAAPAAHARQTIAQVGDLGRKVRGIGAELRAVAVRPRFQQLHSGAVRASVTTLRPPCGHRLIDG
jgi:hypothetical protein